MRVIPVGPDFWTGAGAAGAAGLFGWLGRMALRRESLEERLQRWQTETVKEVRSENADLRGEVAKLKPIAARLVIVESCLRLAVDALHSIAPESPELRQIGTLLRTAIPVDPDTPDDMHELMQKIDRRLG